MNRHEKQWVASAVSVVLGVVSAVAAAWAWWRILTRG